MSQMITFAPGDRRVSLSIHSPVAVEGEDGVFTATIKWTLVVTVDESSQLYMLPDVVAGLFWEYLPIRGTIYHPGRPWVTCRTVKCEHVKGGQYTYTATYSDKNSTEEEQGTNENPLLDRPIVKSIAGMQTKAIYKDRDGKAILNKANDPVVQTVENNTIGFKVEANVAFVPTWILTYRNCTNNAPFTIGGLPVATDVARFVLESDYVEGPKSRNDITYLVFKYTLLFDEIDKHYGVPMNAGYNELVNNEQVPIILPGGAEPNSPHPLTLEGARIENPTPENVNFLEIKKYPQADFSVLPGVNL